MTDELTKTFFDTFDIQYEFCSDICLNPCKFQCNDCEFRTERYPQITDRRLLELICIWNLYCTYTLIPTNYQNVKEYVLNQFLLIDTYNFIVDLPIVKHQVRKLFEEG